MRPADFDRTQRFVTSYVWTLPKLGVPKRVADVLNGWSLSGVTELQTGHPFDIFGNRDSNHTGLSARVTIIGSPNQPAGVDKALTGPVRSAFELTPFDVQPNLSKNAFYGPNMINFDAAVLKDTAVMEKAKLELRFEFFNLFNHTQFAQPGNAFAAPGTFGLSTATIGRPDGTTSARQIQLAAKIIF